MSGNAAQLPREVADFFGNGMLLGYVATLRPDGGLANVPTGVVIHEGQIRISTPADSLKVRNLRQDPHIAVCVPAPADARRYLLIRGRAELAEDTDRRFIGWIARTHMGLDDHPHEPAGTARVTITVVPERFIFAGAQGS